jgi:hypothetical protein
LASAGRLFLITLALCWAAAWPAAAAGAETSRPVKLAVFGFELEDWSAGGPIAGESPVETARLGLVTDVVRKALEQSGRYALVDTDAADADAVKSHRLRNCNGCEADIALKLGAEQSLLGVVNKVSVLVHTVIFEIRDTATGKVVRRVQTDLRSDSDESWSRAVTWLITHRLFEDDPGRS